MSVREWLGSYDGNGDGPLWRKMLDTVAIWTLLAGSLAVFLGACWVIAAAKRGHW